MDEILSVKNLKTYFNSQGEVARAVDGVSMTIYPQEIVCIVGESGSGKSVTSLSIMGLITESKEVKINGEILFEDKDLLKLNEKQLSDIRGNEISMIFQEPMTSLNPVLTIGDQITEVLYRHKKIKKKDAIRITIDMLKTIGVPRSQEIIHEYPHQLSGGMRQRVMIAMAMVCNPKLLIADEPTTALDVTTQSQILELMKEMCINTNTSIIFITHDLAVVSEIADRVYVMYAGQVVESAKSDAIFENPLNPYTQALLASVPSLEQTKTVFNTIPGVIPSSTKFPKGCRFAERCSIAQSSCFEKMPELREIETGHFVRCDLV